MVTLICDRCKTPIATVPRDTKDPSSHFPAFIFDETCNKLTSGAEKDLCEKCARDLAAVLGKWWPELAEYQRELNKPLVPKEPS